VVDLAAEQGGNCGYTECDQANEVGGVTVIGYTDLTSRLATQSSQLFGTNLVNLLSDMTTDGVCAIDLEDEVVRKSMVLRDGEITWPPAPDPEKAVAPPPTDEAAKAAPPAEASAPVKDTGPSSMPMVFAALVGAAAIYVGLDESMSIFVQQLTVFMLACFVGWQVVWNVTAALHTPLMSVTNAISGIIIVGGMLQAGNSDAGELAQILGAIAILVASINIAGGFLVTQRMLAMFRK
jgi:NAD(P) transhydrogenase subunit alpha